MQYDFPDFDAFSKAQGTTTIDAAADPQAANAALAGIFDAGPAPEPTVPGDNSCVLPVGVEIDGELLRTVRVRELNGEDEEELSRSGTNPFRHFDTILRRATVEIDGHWSSDRMLKSMAVADRDTILLAIRIATYGPDYTWEQWTCPECGDRSDLTFHLDEMEITGPQSGNGEYDVELRGGVVAHVRLPNGADQAELFADESLTAAQQNSLLIGRCVLYTTDPEGAVVKGNPDLGRQLGLADRKRLMAAMGEHTYGPRLDAVTLVHEACGKEVQVALPLAALFR